MKRLLFVLQIAIMAALLILDSTPVRAQLAAGVAGAVPLAEPTAAADEERRKAGRAILEAEAKRLLSTFNEQFDTKVTQAQIKLRQLEIKQEEYRLRAKRMDRAARSRPAFGSITSGIQESINRRDVDSTHTDLIKQVEEYKAQLKELNDSRALNLLAFAWSNLTHEQRTQILDSNCLSELERRTFLEQVDAPTDVDLPVFTNHIGMTFREVPAGSFTMGATLPAPGANNAAKVVLMEVAFWIGENEVSQKEYMSVIKQSNPSENKPSFFARLAGDESLANYPVEHVTWHDAVRFCMELSKQQSERDAKRFYRLPTEAEWEYACRGGTTTAFSFGAAMDVTGYEANLDFSSIESNNLGYVTPTGKFPPNPFGLLDMHGNVSEWCSDWFDENYYATGPDTNPPGPAEGFERGEIRAMEEAVPPEPVHEAKVVRGGSFSTPFGAYSTSFARSSCPPDGRGWIGFRVVCEKNAPSDITRRQYRELLDFDAGKKRTTFSRARSEYHNEILRRISSLEEPAMETAGAEEDEQVVIRKKIGEFSALESLYLALARYYQETGDELSKKLSYGQAARNATLRLIAYKLEDPDYDPKQESMLLAKIADHFQNSGDNASAKQHAEAALTLDPAGYHPAIVLKRLAESEEKAKSAK